MNANEFEAQMRGFEYFHNLRLLPDTWMVIRVDGRSFSRLTAELYEKPFDSIFRDCMVATAQALLEEFQGIYAYTQSDEISVVLPPDWAMFDRELEKTISVSAGLASSIFSLESKQPAHFDSRIWVGVKLDKVVDYFRWRQTDATRNALNGWAYWTLRKAGQTERQATKTLEQRGADFKNELLFQHGINFNEVPLWQRRGTGLYWKTYSKEGFNPIQQQTVVTTRKHVKIDLELPMKDDYNQFVLGLLESSQQSA